MTDQFARHEIAGHGIARQEIAGHETAGHKNDGPKMTAGREVAGEQSFNRDNIIYNEVCKFLNPKTHVHTVSYRRVLKSAN